MEVVVAASGGGWIQGSASVNWKWKSCKLLKNSSSVTFKVYTVIIETLYYRQM